MKGPVNRLRIGGQVRAYKKVFEQVEADEVPLLIAGGIEAFSAYMAAHLAHKKPLFIQPEEVSNYGAVFTTKHTIIHWNFAPMDHSNGTLNYLPEHAAWWRWNPPELQKETEASHYLKDQKVWMNTYFEQDPELFVAMTNVALRKKIPVILPFTGVQNSSWQKRVATYLNDEIR